MNAQPALLPEHNNIVPFPQRHKLNSDEWYTPSSIIEAARFVMHGIDLDPASCPLANETVKATWYYTKEQDGLLQPFYGRVWCNPPFGRINGSGKSVIHMFVTRIVQEYKAGHVEQAIMLLTAQVTTAWFRLIWDYPICFVDHRIHFNKMINGHLRKESRDSHMLGTVLVYLGPNFEAFVEAFSQFGTIARRVSAPRKSITPLSLWGEL